MCKQPNNHIPLVIFNILPNFIFCLFGWLSLTLPLSVSLLFSACFLTPFTNDDPCNSCIRIKEKICSAGITVSHVLYGLKTYFTYNLYHQTIQLTQQFHVCMCVVWCWCRTTRTKQQLKMHNPNKCNNFVYTQTYRVHKSKEQNAERMGTPNKPTKQHKIVTSRRCVCCCCFFSVFSCYPRAAWQMRTEHTHI